MKTGKLVLGIVVAACALFASTHVSAQDAQQDPAIRVYQSGDALKVVFGYDSQTPVFIDFQDDRGSFATDKVTTDNIKNGFIRRYQVERHNNTPYWVNVKNELVSARFRITKEKGRQTSTLETVTYHNPIAKR